MSADAAGLLTVARSQLGMTESPFGSNRTPYGKWYGLDGQAWCDMFVSWCADQAGLGDVVGKFAYTPSHANWFRSRGQWGSVPAVGAIVFFQWPGMGRIGHVGIVEAPISGGCIAIEGNTDVRGGRTGGRVMRQARRANIAGYGYPAYAAAPARPTPPDGLAVDGELGPQTISALQASLNRTGARPAIAVDGEWGPQTVRALQERLNYLHPPVTSDGEMGPQTIKALQTVLNVAVDGELGPKTITTLQIRLRQGEL